MSARMVLLGPPGAGKGTQAARIAERLGIPAISTGDIFRANVAGATELGTQAKAYMDKGEYVPDSITNAMVADRIAQADCENGFLLDGYPRTTAQVGELDSMLKASGLALDVVVEITADAEAVVARLLKRAGEQGRADDTEPVIRRRLEVYAESTAPLADIYAERGGASKMARADSLYQLAIDANPQDADVLNNYAYRLAKRGEELDMAERYAGQAIKLSPEAAHILDTYAYILLLRKNYTLAKLYQRRALEQAGDKASVDMYDHLGDIYLGTGELDAALEAWHTALKLDTEHKLDEQALRRKIHDVQKRLKKK